MNSVHITFLSQSIFLFILCLYSFKYLLWTYQGPGCVLSSQSRIISKMKQDSWYKEQEKNKAIKE